MAQQDSSVSLTVRHRFSASSASFLSQLGMVAGGMGLGEQEMDVIMLDHCYSKPWSAHPDASSARPLRMLFMPKQTRPSPLEMLHRNIDSPVDVVDAPPTPSMPFDISKARSLMTECERHASYARTDNQEDWEEKLSKSGWTVQQSRLYTKVMKILQADRCARLALESAGNEPIARRQVVDKTAKRLRQTLASVGWDMEVVQWLHQLILDNVSVHYLACYLDALQTLKAKVPSLVEKMLSGAPPKHPSLSHEALGLLLKRPWDPVGTALTQQKLKKLPGNPLLLMAPSGPSQSGASHTGHAKRLKFWQVYLNSLGKTIMTNMSGGSGVSVVLCLEQMIGALRTKVLEQKSHHPGRPIILVGWNIGALVACHVSLVESVNAVVCLGFPFTGIHGPRGDCEDPLLGSQTPTLFVIGQNTSDCSIDQLQDLREHMRAETGMLVVGGADEQLRLSHRQKREEGLTQAMADRCVIKREEGLTQAMADRCVIDEVYQFLGSILSMNAGLPDLPLTDMAQVDIRKKRKRKSPQDLMGALVPDKPASAAAGQSHAVGKTPTLHGGTGRVSKRGGKAARMAAAAATAGAASGGTALPAEGSSRPASRKRQGRGGVGAGPRKRLALGLGHLGGVHTSRSSGSLQAPNLSTVSALSSAPELSGILQGIRISRPSDGDSVVVGGSRSLMGTSFPLTKVLTFSKLLEGGDAAGDGGAVSGAATLLASAVRSGDGSDKEKTHQQQQFLVKTAGSSGSPLAIPISMAQRLMAGGSSPLVHITGSGSSGSSQIHQLLTSIACSSSSSSASLQPQTAALLINTTTQSSVPAPPTVGAQEAGRQRAVPPEKAEGLGHMPGEKGDGDMRLKEAGQDPRGVAGKQSGRVCDAPGTTTTLSAATHSSVVAQLSQKGHAVVNEATSLVTGLTQSAGVSHSPGITQSTGLTQSVGVTHSPSVTVPGQASGTTTTSTVAGQGLVAKQASLTNPLPPGQHISISKIMAGKTLLSSFHHTSSSQSSFNSPGSSTEVGQSKSESALSAHASPLMKSGFVQLGVTKSLINTGTTVTSHSILRVAGTVTSTAYTGSPVATTSILGGRGAVLISPAIAKSLSSVPTAILFSKAGSSSGNVTSYKPTMEVLGKVSSVLEPGAKGRQPSATPSSSTTSTSLITVPVSLSKSGVLSKAGVISKSDMISALKGSKPTATVTQALASPVCVASSSAGPAPTLTTAASAAVTPPTVTSGGGGGRGGHKSGSAVSYAASSKPVLPTPTSTRTRKIRTPKQYDL
ncbi:hypothetical protein ACOMHN_062762 [Nucella lapillus]